jgi:hypothetical protein
MLQGIAALADDPQTRVIVLISKPPSPAIAQRILDAAAASGKPVVVDFLGAPAGAVARPGIVAAHSLQHAADAAVALAQGRAPPPPAAAPPVDGVAATIAAMAPTQRDVRGLFSGGTFCYETQLVFLGRGLACRSNAPVHGALPYEGHDARHAGHLFLDLGDDEYTRGRPHPMIDPSQRNAAIRAHAADPTVAALLFDVVLGFGAHPDPAAELAAALRDARAIASTQQRTLALIGHVCGTEDDPQDKARQRETLADAGAVIAASNFEAAALAAEVAIRCGGGPA